MVEARENQNLKAAGMVLLGTGGLSLMWLSSEAAAQWPIAADHFLTFTLVTVITVNVLAAGLLLIAAGCDPARSWRDPRRRRALMLKLLLANVLVPAVLYALLTADTSVEAELADSGWDVPLSVAGTLMAVTAWRMWRRSQRHEASDAEEAMARDSRPPVLYLRSFRDDGTAVLDDGGAAWIGRLIGAIGPQTPEQELSEILGALGPLVAIGKPGEPLPELGAARLYVPHDQWQRKVIELMHQASLVVVRVGSSAGVLWEIETALAEIPRQRLVFTVLGAGGGSSVAPEVRARLAPLLGSHLDAALPQPAPSLWKTLGWRDPRRRLGGLVCFSADGTPHPVPVSLWPLWGRDMATVFAFRPSAMPLRRAWRQVFAHLGLEAERIGGQRSRVTAVLLAVGLGYLGAHWFYLGDRRRGWKYVALFPVALASMFMAVHDAYRFVWMDRRTFDSFTGDRGVRS